MPSLKPPAQHADDAGDSGADGESVSGRNAAAENISGANTSPASVSSVSGGSISGGSISGSISDGSVSDGDVGGLLRAVAHAPFRNPMPVILPGSTWGDNGRYVIDHAVGRGGMGRVYAATDSLLGRQVALKILDARRADNESLHRARLLREARLAAVVEHERIARVYDVGEHDGTLFLAMEFVRGETLRARLDKVKKGESTLEGTEILRIVTQILEGLAVLHARDIVHRDLKPENVMLAESGAKLLDFGLAKTQSLEDVGYAASGEAEGAPHGVSHGKFSGTPGYMAPEQCNGEVVDPRADLFSLGVLVFEIVEGKRPFGGAGTSAVETMVATREADAPTLTPEKWQRVPAALRVLAERSLVRDKERRCKSVAEALEILRQEEAKKSKWPLNLTLLALAALAVSGGAYGYKHTRYPSPSTAVIPTGMVRIAGGDIRMGSTDEELRAECERDGPRCPRQAILDREKPSYLARIRPFLLDINEVTNKDFAATLSSVNSATDVPMDADEHYRRYVRLVSDTGQLAEKKILYDLWHEGNGIEYIDDPVRGKDFRAKPGWETLPVGFVSWYGASFYCHSRGKRLPTEDEWEAAARGSENRRYPWGSDAPRCGGVLVPFDAELPTDNPISCPGEVKPRPVGTSPQDVTPDGVHDMGGSMSEWVDASFTLTSRATKPQDASSDLPAVLRGGSWEESIMVRSPGRNRYTRDGFGTNVGFRCAADAID